MRHRGQKPKKTVEEGSTACTQGDIIMVATLTCESATHEEERVLLRNNKPYIDPTAASRPKLSETEPKWFVFETF